MNKPDAEVAVALPGFPSDADAPVLDAFTALLGAPVARGGTVLQESMEPPVNPWLQLGEGYLIALAVEFSKDAVLRGGKAAAAKVASVFSALRDRYPGRDVGTIRFAVTRSGGEQVTYLVPEGTPVEALGAMKQDFDRNDGRIGPERWYIDEGWMTAEEYFEWKNSGKK